MSNAVTDFEKNVLHMSQQELKALNAISDVIGAISTVWGYGNAAKSILSALGVFPGSDPLNQLRQAIDQLSTEFQAFLGALSQQLTMLEVANQIESARTALQLLQELAPNDAATYGIDPTWDAQRPIVEHDSLNAVNTLGDKAYWERPFFPELVYSQPWAERLNLTPAHTDLVFEYRWTLPAYLEAISIRLTVLAAVRKDLRDSKITDELTTMVNTLEGLFNTIRMAIFELPWPPSYSWEVCDIDYYSIFCWAQQGAPVGAVELYSTFSQVDSWPQGELPSPSPPAPPNPGDYRKFVFRFFVRAVRHWKQLFHGIGLDAAAATLIKLKVIAGISPAVIDPLGTFYGLDQSHAPTGDWSVRELAQRMFFSSYWFNPVQVLPSPYPRPTGLPPSSLRQMLQDLQTFGPQPNTSLRSVLAQ